MLKGAPHLIAHTIDVGIVQTFQYQKPYKRCETGIADLSSMAKQTNPMQTGNVRLLHSQTECADSKTKNIEHGVTATVRYMDSTTCVVAHLLTLATCLPHSNSWTTESHSEAALVGLKN